MKKIRRYIRLLKIISPDVYLGIAGIIFIVLLFAFGKFFYHISLQRTTLIAPIPKEYAHLSLTAKAVYVYDLAAKRELFSQNGDAQLPLASLTKIMMAVTTLSLLPDSTIVIINPEFLKSEGDSGLYGNERWRLKDLLDLTLLESSNDGANAIAARAGQVGAVAGAAAEGNPPYDFGREQFVYAMNKKALELGLAQTYFLNPTGLDENESVSGAYGSARDVAVLFSYAITKYPELFGATRYENRKFDSLSALRHEVKNTNTFVAKIPSLLASKTGYTDLAGGNLTIAIDLGPNRPIVISVLGSSEKGRFDDAEKLVWSTLEYLSHSI